MIRRTALLTLSAAPLPLAIGAAASVGVPHAAAAAVGTPELSDAGYRRMTLMVGTLALLTSEVALGRATRADVRQFARFEVDEQSTVAEVLTDRPNPPPAPLSPEQRRILARLRALSGAAFDRQYVIDQIAGHQELQRIQQAYIRTGNNRDLLHIAKLNASRIREHLVELGELRRLVGA